jgi:N6-L-threonylcarbamoyladenine synthase
VLAEAGATLADIDVVAYTRGPGLAGALLVGSGVACALAASLGKPVLGVHHLEGHLLSPFLSADPPEFPFIALLVSGGHTQLLAVRGVGDYVRLGTTIDDAVGEAFDKVAKMLSLPYPGGPSVEREALQGDPEAFDFPRPMLGRPEPNFSLSGLKTAVRLAAERIAPLSDQAVRDLCASFQAAVVDVMVERTRVGLKAFRAEMGKPTCLVVAGGVAANIAIQRGLARLATEAGLRLVAPPLALCGDNGAMIAWAGLERLRIGLTDGLDAPPRPRWPLEARKPEAPLPALSALPGEIVMTP